MRINRWSWHQAAAVTCLIKANVSQPVSQECDSPPDTLTLALALRYIFTDADAVADTRTQCRRKKWNQFKLRLAIDAHSAVAVAAAAKNSRRRPDRGQTYGQADKRTERQQDAGQWPMESKIKKKMQSAWADFARLRPRGRQKQSSNKWINEWMNAWMNERIEWNRSWIEKMQVFWADK